MWLLISILVAFLAFMVAVWGVHATDDYALARYGYAPFAMPNVLFMLIPNAMLLVAIGGGGTETQLLVTLAGLTMLAMLLLVRSRTNGWIALFAAPLMLFCAPVLVFSVFFRGLARGGGSEGN